MGPELMMQMMTFNSSQQMMKSMMDNTIDEEKRIDAFNMFCEEHDIDVADLLGNSKKTREVMRLYKAILRTSK